MATHVAILHTHTHTHTKEFFLFDFVVVVERRTGETSSSGSCSDNGVDHVRPSLFFLCASVGTGFFFYFYFFFLFFFLLGGGAWAGLIR